MSTDRPPFVVTRFPADDPKFPGCFAFRDDEDESMDEAFVVTEGAARRLFVSLASVLPEARGYVVLIPNRSETFEVGATGVIFSDVGQANAEAAWAEREFGLTGAHVGVVTALT